VNQMARIAGQQNNAELKNTFLRWQCRVRQIMMRDGMGRPDDAITPEVTLVDDRDPMGCIITVLCRTVDSSCTAELKHMVKCTNDPAQRRSKAVEFLSETYYQHAREFSDMLTATFTPCSSGAVRIEQAGKCNLRFAAYNQHFDLSCRVSRLAIDHPLHEATLWHNLLFNPDLHPQTTVLAFEPDWDCSTAESPAL
jgi:hypothetical protein